MITIDSATMYWDPTIESYRLMAPFSLELISFLKKNIPSDKRQWVPESKEWLFDRTYFDVMKFMVTRMWPRSNIVTEEEVRKTEEERQQRQQSFTLTPRLIDAQSKFLELCELSTMPTNHSGARRAYLNAVKRLHPDAGGDTERTAELNSCWSFVKKEVFKR